MKLEKIKFNELIPSEYNPRKIKRDEMKQLQNNLEEFGLVDPIIINLKNNHIIGGHQRYQALRNNYERNKEPLNPTLNLIQLGDIGWVFENRELKLDDETQEKALNLSLNKISGEWDYEKLGLLFDDLDNSNFNLKFTGFDSFEIEQIRIPSNLKEQFQECEDINEGKREATYNEEKQEDLGNHEITESSLDDLDDEVLVDEEEIEKITKYKCPKCGYEW